ncbi:potassium-transporting ATPase subunit C, partial [Salmonella enterica]|uniref:potassium-transporting ATPase subunit C n=1 Tax=Salmonella enterica TaxID=28901 RepID=UPI0007B495B0
FVFRPFFSKFFFLFLLPGGCYPFLPPAWGQWCFPWRVKASLFKKDIVIRGSAFIGQSFPAAGFFHGRPSATA